METKIYHLTRNGMELAEKNPVLEIGSRVYSFGFGMSESIYAVMSEPTKNGTQKLVKMDENYEGQYFGPFQNFDKYDRKISKKFGIGFYWDDIDPDFRFSEDEINKAIKSGETFLKEQEIKAKEQAEKDKIECEKLPKLFPYLTPLTDRFDKKNVKKNLIADLKNNFPGVKFSVRKEHYDTYYVRWDNGPAEDDVKKITSKYEDHESDWSGDYWDYSPSNFNNVFGGFKFVFESRTLTIDIEPLKEQVLNLISGMSDYEAGNYVYKMLRKTTFPAVFSNVRFEKTGIKCGSFDEFYKINFDVPEEKNESENWIADFAGSNIELVDYSEKSIAVIGETKPIKEQLKKLGGKFNFRLSCGPGWIFPKSKKDELLQFI